LGRFDSDKAARAVNRRSSTGGGKCTSEEGRGGVYETLDPESFGLQFQYAGPKLRGAGALYATKKVLGFIR